MNLQIDHDQRQESSCPITRLAQDWAYGGREYSDPDYVRAPKPGPEKRGVPPLFYPPGKTVFTPPEKKKTGFFTGG
jgi:hypothetical protein